MALFRRNCFRWLDSESNREILASAMAKYFQHFGPRPHVARLQDQLVPPHVWENPNKLLTGSYSSDGIMDPDSGLRRRYRPYLPCDLGQPFPELPDAKLSVPRAIFAGPLLPAYGHFLLESLSRLWAAPAEPDYPILWTLSEGSEIQELLPWMRDLLDLLGLRNPIILAREPTVVSDMVLPRPGYEIQYRFAWHHAQFLARVPWTPQPDRKLWISRSDIDRSGDRGAGALETALLRDGWRIIRPETLPIREQLRELSLASRIAGEQGSALHSLIFLKPAHGLRLDLFARDPELSGHHVNANQATICAQRAIDYRYHLVREEVVIGRSGPRVNKRYAAAEIYLKQLAKH